VGISAGGSGSTRSGPGRGFGGANPHRVDPDPTRPDPLGPLAELKGYLVFFNKPYDEINRAASSVPLPPHLQLNMNELKRMVSRWGLGPRA
jgi:hypothetical protein